MADAMCGGYYSTEPNQAGGGGYWTASIELNGDFVVAEVYGDTADEVRDRCHAFLSGLASPPAREEAPAEGAGDRDQIKRAIADGFSNGYEPYDEASEMQRLAYDMAADAVLALRNRTSEPEAGAVAPYVGETADLIDQLRLSEGNAVTIMCDNPDFNGQPNSAVEIVADWTNWQTVRFTGDNVIEALRNARDRVGGKIMGECASLTRIQIEQVLTHPAPATADKLRVAVEALEKIADEAPYRSGYCQSDVEYGPKLSDIEMQTEARQALAALNEQPQ